VHRFDASSLNVDQAVDVVGFTIAEFIPRQVMHLQQILKGFPLIEGAAAAK
jgi:arginase